MSQKDTKLYQRKLSTQEMCEMIGFYRMLCGFLFYTPKAEIDAAMVNICREKLKTYGEEKIWESAGEEYLIHQKTWVWDMWQDIQEGRL